MKLEIRKYPDPILLKKAEKIKDPLSDDIQGLIFQMIETLRESKGVGLAAPQVGVSLRLFIVELEGTIYVMINPKITSTSRKKEVCEEGCLSFPGKFLPVPRYEEVQIRFTDQYGKSGKVKAQGLLARAFQHEYDHLDGIVFTSRAKKVSQKDFEKKETKPKLKELKLKIVFMGTSELSGAILQSLIKKHEVVGVFTKPDTKVGRKQEETAPLVKKIAENYEIPVFQPEKFNEQAINDLKKLDPDLVIVAAYGKIIPQDALDIPKYDCINVHASLLPKYRGSSPIQNVLINGEAETGITIMLMDKGVDTGAILSQEKLPIGDEDNIKTLTEKFSVIGSVLLLKTIQQWVNKKIKPQPQNNNEATMCQLIERNDGRVYWDSDAKSIYNLYRGLTPWPGIFCCWKNNSRLIRLKLISIMLQENNPSQEYKEGEVFEIGNDIGVQTGKGIIILKEIQQEGKNKMTAKEFANGQPNFIGSILQ